MEFICVLDFEATCDRDKRFTPSHEVIEFPSVMLQRIDGKYQAVGEFQEFCRPLYNIKLTQFCKDLTGITQEQVSRGADFPQVLQRHQEWLSQYSLDPDRLIIVTCGRWDLVEMLPDECRRWSIKPHPIYHRVINIKDAFCKKFGPFRGGMAPMLAYLGLELKGRHHSGIDDCRNIAQMVVNLADCLPDLIIEINPKIYDQTKAERIKTDVNRNRQLAKRGQK